MEEVDIVIRKYSMTVLFLKHNNNILIPNFESQSTLGYPESARISNAKIQEPCCCQPTIFVVPLER